MEASDLRAKTESQLLEQLTELEKERFNLRFQAASGQLENTARVRLVRRDIARVKTILREKTPMQAADKPAPSKPATKKSAAKKAATKKSA